MVHKSVNESKKTTLCVEAANAPTTNSHHYLDHVDNVKILDETTPTPTNEDGQTLKKKSNINIGIDKHTNSPKYEQSTSLTPPSPSLSILLQRQHEKYQELQLVYDETVKKLKKEKELREKIEIKLEDCVSKLKAINNACDVNITEVVNITKVVNEPETPSKLGLPQKEKVPAGIKLQRKSEVGIQKSAKRKSPRLSNSTSLSKNLTNIESKANEAYDTSNLEKVEPAIEVQQKLFLSRYGRELAQVRSKLKEAKEIQKKKTMALKEALKLKNVAMKEVREIKRQRKSPRCKKALDDLWNLRYEELLRFKEEYNHCCVPKSHLVPGSQSPYKKLSRWVRTQRQSFILLKEGKRSCLNHERLQLLNSAGFIWEMTMAPSLCWADRLNQMKQYKEMHGDTNVPHLNKDPPGLGNWVQTQRKEYGYHIGRNKVPFSCKGVGLNEMRIKDLNDIGFEWSLRNRSCFRKTPTEEQVELDYKHEQDGINKIEEGELKIDGSAKANEEAFGEQPQQEEEQDAGIIALEKASISGKKLKPECEHDENDNNIVREVKLKINGSAEASEDNFIEQTLVQEGTNYNTVALDTVLILEQLKPDYKHEQDDDNMVKEIELKIDGSAEVIKDDFEAQQDDNTLALNTMPEQQRQGPEYKYEHEGHDINYVRGV